MIPKSKLEKLSDDELDILLYCVNMFKSGENEINMEELYWLRPHFVYLALNDQASKIKPEHVTLLQKISDILTNNQ